MSGGPADFAAKITSGATGTQTLSNTRPVRGVRPGECWYFSYFYKATRVTGTNTATIVPTVDWYDATDTLIAGQSTNGATQTINATVGWTNPEDVHIAPATAVSAKVRFTTTPGGGTFQHDIYLTNMRFARTQVGSDVTAKNAAVGDGNRVVNSLMEAGTNGYGKLADSAGVGGSIFSALDSGTQKTYVGLSGTFTAASQTVSPGTFGNNGTAGIPFRIRCQGNERLYVGAKLAVTAPAGSSWSLVANFFDSSNNVIGGAPTIASGAGNVTLWTLKDGFCTTPPNAAWMIIQVYVTSGTTGAFACYISEPMVCTAGALQTTSPQFSPGPSTVHSGPGGNLLGDVDGNGRPNIDMVGTGHTNRGNLFRPPSNMLFNGGLRVRDSSGKPLGFTWDSHFSFNTAGSVNQSTGAAYEDPYAYISGPQTAQTFVATSDVIPVYASANYVLQAEMFAAGLTAGTWALDIQWYSDAAGTSQAGLTGADGPDMQATAGANWTKYWQTYSSPAGAVSCRIRIFISVATISSGQVVGIRRIKLNAAGVISGETQFTDDATSSHAAVTRSGTGIRVGDQRNLPAVNGMNLRYRVTGQSSGLTTGLLGYNSAPTSATITIAATNVLIGSVTVAYGSMTTASFSNPGTAPNNADFHVYVDDPTYGGGTLTLNAVAAANTSTASNAIFQSDGRVYLGTVTVAFPSSGTGTGSGGGSGGGGSCPVEDEWVLTQHGWVQAKDIIPGYHAGRVMTLDGEGYEWALFESNERAYAQCALLTGEESGVAVRVSLDTPITLMGGEVVGIDGCNGVPLPFYTDDGHVPNRWWECVNVDEIGIHPVRKLGINQRTYVAGSVAGRGIATHNPKP